ncbi:uncharacterized protein BX664DRAFT_314257 [Halteromyces radiatus]|uniref:uncharacterized protein n=1 Tax=Halteromyces radiatus TaxID=101107 RepID=UPI00221FD1B1|nr:uncharacterized protein BX664DRAFT_314257 [Halteromyces radiatus]KAI8089011.1 hypothetical protein BX664DRAFT_314257 [Halteromyces radiatus]
MRVLNSTAPPQTTLVPSKSNIHNTLKSIQVHKRRRQIEDDVSDSDSSDSFDSSDNESNDDDCKNDENINNEHHTIWSDPFNMNPWEKPIPSIQPISFQGYVCMDTVKLKVVNDVPLYEIMMLNFEALPYVIYLPFSFSYWLKHVFRDNKNNDLPGGILTAQANVKRLDQRNLVSFVNMNWHPTVGFPKEINEIKKLAIFRLGDYEKYFFLDEGNYDFSQYSIYNAKYYVYKSQGNKRQKVGHEIDNKETD